MCTPHCKQKKEKKKKYGKMIINYGQRIYFKNPFGSEIVHRLHVDIVLQGSALGL